MKKIIIAIEILVVFLFIAKILASDFLFDAAIRDMLKKQLFKN